MAGEISRMLDAAEISLSCPKCRRKFKKTIGWIKTHRNFACPCGARFTTGKAGREIAELATKADRANASLQNILKNLNKGK